MPLGILAPRKTNLNLEKYKEPFPAKIKKNPLTGIRESGRRGCQLNEVPDVSDLSQIQAALDRACIAHHSSRRKLSYTELANSAEPVSVVKAQCNSGSPGMEITFEFVNNGELRSISAKRVNP